MANNFGTRQNNENDNRKSITTKVYQFKNRDGFEPSTLQISGWDEMFSLRINPALPPDKQSKDQLYDYDKFVATSLNMEKVMLLLYKINKDILPAIENEEEKNIGISVAGDSLVTVGTGKAITQSIRPYIAIHKGLNPDTKKAEQSIYYEFKKSMTVDDYDPNTGDYNVETNISAEFMLFIELLKSFIQNSNFNSHVNRYNNRYSNDRMVNTVNAIADKVGVDLNPKGYSGKTSIWNNATTTTKNTFSNNRSNNSSFDIAMEHISADDLDEALNG